MNRLKGEEMNRISSRISDLEKINTPLDPESIRELVDLRKYKNFLINEI